jgi:hypothetical protein
MAATLVGYGTHVTVEERPQHQKGTFARADDVGRLPAELAA